MFNSRFFLQVLFLGFCLGHSFGVASAIAEVSTDGTEGVSSPASSPDHNASSELSHSSTPASEHSGAESAENPGTERMKSKGRVPREKDAEGTQAPNRFDADIIFKSKYELNGKPLEVDTD